jgi:hypothetical protein
MIWSLDPRNWSSPNDGFGADSRTLGGKITSPVIPHLPTFEQTSLFVVQGQQGDSCSAARTALAIPSLLPSAEFLQHLENCSNKVQDRRLRQTELAADLLVALSLHHEIQDIELPFGQAEVGW